MATSTSSAAHWIAGVDDIEVCTAREWIRVGRRLRVLPVIADMLDANELAYSKIPHAFAHRHAARRVQGCGDRRRRALGRMPRRPTRFRSRAMCQTGNEVCAEVVND
jgi:hypothetical protein